MNYIIVNNSTFNAFYQRAQVCANSGHPLSLSYLEKGDDRGLQIPGGWGCLRFAGPLPPDPVFLPPDKEYRYSPEAGAWLVDGQPTDYSSWVKGLHDYFVSSPWGSL